MADPSQRDLYIRLYQTYNDLSSTTVHDYPAYFRFYGSIGSWSSWWTSGSDAVVAAIEGRNVILIKGSSEAGRGLLQLAWGWNRSTLNRILPGVRYVKVQGEGMSMRPTV